MAKTHPLRRHFAQERSVNPLDHRSVLDRSDRLSLLYREHSGTWRTVAEHIENTEGFPTVWFPDSNVAILPQTECVWDAFRLRKRLYAEEPTAVFSDVVDAELRDWLHEPWRSRDRSRLIQYARENSEWLQLFHVGKESPLELAIYGYVGVLSVRRSLALEASRGKTIVGTTPMEKAETMDRIAKTIGPRAIQLAKKGRQVFEETGSVNVSDEMHCLSVILYALVSKKNCILLTADSDHLEIFFKAQWFLDTHYRAWLAAPLIKSGEYEETDPLINEATGYFDGIVKCFSRKSLQMREVLPYSHETVCAGVYYVSPRKRLTRLTFTFETKMLEMLAVRGLTDGRCTDLFGDLNLHIDLGPLSSGKEGLLMGIGRDLTHSFNLNGVERSLSHLDVIHALNCREQHAVISHENLKAR